MVQVYENENIYVKAWGVWCLMPLSTIFQLYRGSQFYWWGKPICKYPEKTTDHLAITWRPSSVVCKLFTFQTSSPKPLGRLEPNLAGMFLGWSSTKLLFFVPIGYSIWLPGPIICSHKLGKGHSNDHSFTVWVQSVH
jgi:hypothetical protein